MQGVSVRRESSSDIKAVDVVHMSAFEGEAEVGLIDALRQSVGFDPALSLVAEFHGRIVGHVLLTKARLQRERDGVDVLALAPLAVVPSQSHRGIGSSLVNAAVEAGRSQGYGAIVVIGHPEFYRRLGFSSAADWGLRCNLPVPAEAVTAIELNPGCLKGGGTVVYPAQFSSIY